MININHFGGSGDDIIQVQAIFSPNAGHPEATSGSVHTITIGATAGTESVVLATEDITLGDTASVTPISVIHPQRAQNVKYCRIDVDATL